MSIEKLIEENTAALNRLADQMGAQGSSPLLPAAKGKTKKAAPAEESKEEAPEAPETAKKAAPNRKPKKDDTKVVTLEQVRNHLKNVRRELRSRGDTKGVQKHQKQMAEIYAEGGWEVITDVPEGAMAEFFESVQEIDPVFED